jgi:hypothetical protein
VTGEVAVAWNNWAFELPRKVSVFQPGAIAGTSVELPSELIGAGVSLAVSSHEPKFMYVLLTGFLGFAQPSVETLRAVSVPAAEVETIDEADSEAESAHVVGSVDPGGLSGPGTARFEYSTDGVNWTPTPDQTGIIGPGATTLDAQLAGVPPASTVSVRLHVSNEDVSANSPTVTFSTEGVAPRVELGQPGGLGTNVVTLNGRVDPLGEQTTYKFEYGLTDSYGNSAPVGAEEVAGKSHSFQNATVQIDGLDNSTTYHYRLIARNQSGVRVSPDATFTTSAAMATPRHYEQVTPVDKQGLSVRYDVGVVTKPDGNAISIEGNNALNSPGTDSSLKNPRYAEIRSSDGWELKQLDLPFSIQQPANATAHFSSTVALSRDLTHALVASTSKLTPGAVEGAGNLYRRDIQSGKLEFITAGMSVEELTGNEDQAVFYGASTDMSTMILQTSAQLLPQATPGLSSLYEWKPGEGLTLLSVNQAGEPLDGSAQPPSYTFWPLQSFTSEDAARIYYSAQFGADDRGLYLNENGHTELVSPADEVELRDVTANGDFAVYFDLASRDLVEYDRESRSSTVIASNPSGYLWLLGLSEDGRTAYYQESLIPTSSFEPIHFWHEGNTRLVAESEGAGFTQKGIATSPNGRYFVFAGFDIKNQAYDNHSSNCEISYESEAGNRCYEVYVYDAQSETLTCASCPGDGSRSAGPAYMGYFGGPEFSRYAPPFVNDQGEAFFDTPTSLVPADSNGMRDVYRYRGGEVELISPGDAPYVANLAGLTPNGSDVFFTTPQGLVKQDDDRQVDLYDAREGGGISSQEGDEATGCVGSDCRSQVPSAPAAGAAGSESVRGGTLSRRKKPMAKVSVAGVHGTKLGLEMRVSTSMSGRITLTGGQINKRSLVVKSAGSRKITAAWARKSRERWHDGKAVSISVEVSFRSTDAGTASVYLKRKLGK